METERINHQYEVGYYIDDDEKDNYMYVSWDYEDRTLDEFMEREYRITYHTFSHTRSLLWLEEAKTFYKWKAGENLYLFLKSNCDGHFYVYKSKKEYGYYNIQIRPDGYAEMEALISNYIKVDKFYIIANSYYNDNICNSLHK